MRILLGLLGDPAKIELYDKKFYSLFQYDETNSSFYLLGASEQHVNRDDYYLMFNHLLEGNSKETASVSEFSRRKGITSRIGLFPSSTKQLIRGPGFIFAPFPVNTRSPYLKYKARILIKLLTPVLRAEIVRINYIPLGGKAAKRTKAQTGISSDKLLDQIKNASQQYKKAWSYLEAGSGENLLTNDFIQLFLKAQFDKQIPSNSKNTTDFTIVPQSIYGGGIRGLKDLDNILDMDNNKNFLPNCIIIGNISEENISSTIKIVKRISEINTEYFR